MKTISQFHSLMVFLLLKASYHQPLSISFLLWQCAVFGLDWIAEKPSVFSASSFIGATCKPVEKKITQVTQYAQLTHTIKIYFFKRAQVSKRKWKALYFIYNLPSKLNNMLILHPIRESRVIPKRVHNLSNTVLTLTYAKIILSHHLLYKYLLNS